MKITIIAFISLMLIPLMGFSQNSLSEGDTCFKKGDYACAVIKYEDAFKRTTGRDKQVAEIRLTRARGCAENLQKANTEFGNKKYSSAQEYYQKIIDSNPNDKYAISQVEKCNSLISTPYKITGIVFASRDSVSTYLIDFGKPLESSKMRYLIPRITYENYGGTNISVEFAVKIFQTPGNLWRSDNSPAGCTYIYKGSIPNTGTTKELSGWGNPKTSAYTPGQYTLELWSNNKLIYSTHFEIIKDQNTQTKSAATTTTNSGKSNNTNQSASQQASSASLVTPRSHTFSHYGSSKKFELNTSKPWTVSKLPYWCRLYTKDNNSFTLRTTINDSRYTRNGEFEVSSGDETQKVNISQYRMDWDDYDQVFVIAEVGDVIDDSHYGIAYYGLSYGKTWGKHGFYTKLMSNFNFNSSNADEWGFSSQRHSITAGYVCRLLNWAWVRVGAGYGQYKISYDSYAFENYGPIDIDAGLMLKLGGRKGGLMLSPSVTTTMFKQVELRVGIGWSFATY